MSLISSTLTAASVLPSLGVHGHGRHKKADAAAANATTPEAPASSTQGLLSRLLQTRQELAGVPLHAATGGAAAALGASYNGADAVGVLGTSVNTRV
jgi:hypothetical protein